MECLYVFSFTLFGLHYHYSIGEMENEHSYLLDMYCIVMINKVITIPTENFHLLKTFL